MTDAATIPSDGQAAADASQGAGEASTAGASTPAAAGAESTASAAGADSVSGAAGDDAGLTRPEGIPDEFWDPQAGLKVGDLVSAFRELKASADERTADLPADATKYELKLSDAVTLPDGFKVEIDAADPFFSDVTKELHALGVGQAGVQKLVDAYAKAQIAEQTQAVEQFAAEKAKLGERADARITAFHQWLDANLTQEESGSLKGAVFTATQVRAFEKIIALRKDPTVGQGGGRNVTAFEGKSGESRLDVIRAQNAA